MSRYYTTRLNNMSEVRDLGNSLKALEIITVDVSNSKCVDVLFTGPEELLTDGKEYYQGIFDLTIPPNMKLYISDTNNPYVWMA